MSDHNIDINDVAGSDEQDASLVDDEVETGQQLTSEVPEDPGLPDAVDGVNENMFPSA